MAGYCWDGNIVRRRGKGCKIYGACVLMENGSLIYEACGSKKGCIMIKPANHNAACCCNGCLATSIFECKLCNGVAGPFIHVRIAGIGFHGINYALQGWGVIGLRFYEG